MFLKKIVLFILVSLGLTFTAQAATYPIIVEVSSTANISLVANALNGTVLDSIPGTRVYLLGVPQLPLLSSLQLNLLGIESIEIDKVVPIPARPLAPVVNVPSTTAANWYANQPSLVKIHANSALKYSKGRGVVIADINSRVDYRHPALMGHLTGGYDFVSASAGYAGTLNQSDATFLDQSDATFLDQSDATFLDQSDATFLDQSDATFLDQSGIPFFTNPAMSHGTLCAGVLAVVAPESQIMPLRVFDDTGNADFFSIARAIYYAKDHSVHVINMSFGLSTNSGTIRKAVDAARKAGIILVASAGNNNTATVQYPAGFTGVMSVAATDLLDKKTSFSNYGSTVYVDAPGDNIISAYPGGYYSIVSGTSFSAPIVAGEAALIRSLKTTGIQTAIAGGVVNISTQNPGYTGMLGHGRVDILSAIRR